MAKIEWPVRRRVFSRRGVSVVEIVAATAVFSAIAAMLLPAISGIAGVRDEAARHQLAVMEAANLMERVAVLRAERPLTRQQLDGLSLSQAARDQQFELQYTLNDAPGSPPARILNIEISWENQHGQRGVPVQVVTFLYDAEDSDEAQP